MTTNVLLPQWGMNMEDGLLVNWLVKEGDTVVTGQPLVEIETAKIESELESPASGVVAYIMADAGTTVDVGTLIAVIAEPGEKVSRPITTRPHASPRRTERRPNLDTVPRDLDVNIQVTPVARKLARQEGIELPGVTGSGPKGRITENDVRLVMESMKAARAKPVTQVVPRARLLAREHGIDPNEVQGTGPGGRVLVEDVEEAAAKRIRAPAPTDTMAAAEVIVLRGLRKTIADRMTASVRSMAQVTLTTEADVTDMVKLRENLVSRWRSHRIRPLDLDIIVKATALSLKEHPRLNATLVEGQIRVLKEINIGVAMAVPDGLMVPVIRNADYQELLDIALKMRDLANRSRKADLTINDVTGSTFTITSLSNYEVDAFTPIIDPPQVAILGVGRVAERAAVHAGQLAVRSTMFLSLAFDHRAMDGVPAGEFLRTLKGKLEDPSSIPLE